VKKYPTENLLTG